MRRLQGEPAALGENDAALNPNLLSRLPILGALALLSIEPLPAVGMEALIPSSSPAQVPVLGVGLLLIGLTYSALTAFRARRLSRSADGQVTSIRSVLRCREQEVKRLREELAETRRMNTLGLLSASLAHDLNNHLSAVRMSNKLVARLSPDLPEIQKRVQNIEGSIQHLRDLVESLLGTDRRCGAELRRAEVGTEVAGLIVLVQDGFLAKVKVEYCLPREALVAAVSRTSFRRILLNLIINAAEAMDRHGTLRIQACHAELVSFDSLLLYPAPADRWISVTIEDTGPGIGPEALDRLFDPTFSTKNRENRIGSGLGLYIVHTLSVEEGIGIGIHSQPGQGTRFELFLPEQISDPQAPGTACA